MPGRLVTVPPGAGAADRWVAAVALGGQGHYARAVTLLLGLLHDPAVPRVVAAHAAVTLASHRRQLGGHSAARRYDALGLRLATGAAAVPGVPSVAAARADALTGLAADALGTGDLRGSHDLLARATAACTVVDPAGADRSAIRAGWVAAELALFSGDGPAASRAADAAAARAAGSRSSRHRVKSAIVPAPTPLPTSSSSWTPSRPPHYASDCSRCTGPRRSRRPIWPTARASPRPPP